MSKHTPGPWGLARYSNYAGWAVTGGERGCIAERWFKDAKHIEAIYGDVGEMEANARLIAAAPDLLEALHRIAYGLETDGRTADGMTRAEAAHCARAAIAKADG